ncbi:hypothetical protein KDA14_03090 [Candidatus Saccharibacteria bacterium]|nr:hypothetical protein [Candidatus Saccharibacteria bacterium]
MEEQQPGQVISPGTQGGQASEAPAELPKVDAAPSTQMDATQVEVQLDHSEQLPVSTEAPTQELPTPPPEPTIPEPAQNSAPPQEYMPSSPAAPDTANTQQDAVPQMQEQTYSNQPPTDGQPDFVWTAQEYEHDERGLTWYFAYLFGSGLVGVIVYLLTKDVVSAVVVFIAAAGLIYVVARKPREQTFVLDDGRLGIGKSVYALQTFKTFSVDEHGKNIVLLPMKRFLPPITLYVGEEYRDTVAEYLSHYLPNEQHAPDAVDRLLRKIHL